MSTITWSEVKAPKVPLARSSHGVSVVGDTLFMFGGEHSARDPIGTEVHSLDLGADSPQWVEVAVQGEARPLPRYVRDSLKKRMTKNYIGPLIGPK